MTHDLVAHDVEAVLARAFSDPMPSSRRVAVDRRIDTALDAEATRREGSAPRRRWLPTFPFHPRRLVVAAIAVVLLTGSVAAAGGIFGLLIGDSPLLERVWVRSTANGASVSDAGYTVTLERAGIVDGRLWVAVSVVGVGDVPPADPGRMLVKDAAGTVLRGGTGAGARDEGGVSAMLFGFRIPDGATLVNPFTLALTTVDTGANGERTGTWTFEFDLPPAQVGS